MSDIKFDIYESPANDGEKKKYHVRNTNKQTIHSKDLIHETTLYTSVSRSDWAAVVEGLIDILSEKLGDGKRIHINGLGYFSDIRWPVPTSQRISFRWSVERSNAEISLYCVKGIGFILHPDT